MTGIMATTTATPMATATDAALLRLVWLASPALPVGGFSYSEGLEAAVDAGLVHDEATASRWLLQQLHLALGESDLAVVAQAVTAARVGDETRIAQLDAWVRRTRETAELRLQSEQMGRSLGEWRRSVGEPAPGPHTYPVAFALAAAPVACEVHDVLLAYAFGWAENMMQAAIKAVPLGQGAGQRILQALAAGIPAAATRAQSLGDEDRQAFAPMLAILSSQHEHQYSRLFRS